MSCPWRICRPDEGPIYYFNLDTHETEWSPPEGWTHDTIPEFGVEDELQEEEYEELEAEREAQAAELGSADDAEAAGEGDAAAGEGEGEGEGDGESEGEGGGSGAADGAATPPPPPLPPGDAGDAGGGDGDASVAPPPAPPPPAVSTPVRTAESPPDGEGGSEGSGAGTSAGAGPEPASGGSKASRSSFRSPSARMAFAGTRHSELMAYGWFDAEDADTLSGAGGGGASGSGSGGDGERRPSRVRKRSSRWERRTTASSGGLEGDVYYVNRETGETSWDEPEDAGDEDDQDLDPSVLEDAEDLEDGFARAGLDLFGDEVEEARVAMLAGGADSTACYLQLQRLFTCLTTVGSEAEWTHAIEDGEMRLPKRVFSFWGPASPPEVSVLVAKIIVMMSNLSEEVILRAVDGEWGCNLRRAVGGAMAQLHSVVDSPTEEAEDVAGAWLLFLRALLLAVEPALEALEYTVAELPGDEFVRLLYDLVEVVPEELSPTVVVVLVTLHSIYTNFEFDGPTPVIAQAATYKPATNFGKPLLVVLNGHGCPYDDEDGLRRCLRCFKDMFDYKPASQLMYTNDLRVLVDVVLRELGNLPGADRVRLEYLSVLRTLLVRSQWLASGRYRREDILTTLDTLQDDDQVEAGLDPDVQAYVEAMLPELIALLE